MGVRITRQEVLVGDQRVQDRDVTRVEVLESHKDWVTTTETTSRCSLNP